jgi:hypothetical protein
MLAAHRHAVSSHFCRRFLIRPKHDVRCGFSWHVLGAVKTQAWQVQAPKQGFPNSEQHRGDRQVHLADQAGAQKLANGLHAPMGFSRL